MGISVGLNRAAFSNNAEVDPLMGTIECDDEEVKLTTETDSYTFECKRVATIGL